MAIQVTGKTAGSGAVGNFFALTNFTVTCINSGCSVVANYDLWLSQDTFDAGDTTLNVPKQFISQISTDLLSGADPWSFLDQAFLTWANTQNPSTNASNDPDFDGATLVPYDNIGSQASTGTINPGQGLNKTTGKAQNQISTGATQAAASGQGS
jgi:hypothetical protein